MLRLDLFAKYLWCLPVVSLGWVTLGAATDGVTPLFFSWKPGNLFLLIAVTITIAFYCFHSGVTPSRVGCHLFYLSDLVSPLFFVNLPTQFFFLRVSPPLEGVTRDDLTPLRTSLVTPLTFTFTDLYNNNSTERATILRRGLIGGHLVWCDMNRKYRIQLYNCIHLWVGVPKSFTMISQCYSACRVVILS